MRFLDRISRKFLDFLSGYGGVWQSPGSPTPLFRGLDIFRSQPAPTDVELVNVFDDTVFDCVSVIARQVGKAPLKLYYETGNGEQKLKKNFKRVSKKQLDWLSRNPHTTARVRKSLDIQEVTHHEILDILDNPNPYMSRGDVLDLHVKYLLTVGAAYIHMKGQEGWYESGGTPDQLWPKESQYVTPYSEDEHRKYITHYKVYAGLGQTKEIPRDEMVVFQERDLADPYRQHFSPLRAAYERVKLVKSELSYFQQTLLNGGFSQLYLTSQDDVGPATAERMVKQFGQKYSATHGGAGGLSYLPPGWGLNAPPAPNTVWNTEQARYTKECVCNAFDVPPELFQQSSNYATYYGAMARLYQDVIIPLLRDRDEILTKQFVSKFDPDGRLFLASEEPHVQMDPEVKNRVVVDQYKAGLILGNEAREELGYDPHEQLDVFFEQTPQSALSLNLNNQLPAADQPKALPAVEQPQPDDQSQATASNDLRATVGGSQAVLAIQQSYYAGSVSYDAARANLVLVFGFTDQEAADLLAGKPEPQVEEPAPEQPAEEPPQPQAEPVQKAVKFPDPFDDQLRRQVQQWLRATERESLARLQSHPDATELFDPERAADELKQLLTPTVAALVDQQATAFAAQYSLDPESIRVVQPKLREAVDHWCGELCESTVATTALQVDEAITQLRAELVAGNTKGEVTNKIADRVRDIFTGATAEKSYEIAVTESARLTGQAQLLVAKESGLKLKKKWIARPDCCDKCQELNGVVKELDEDFIVDGTGPYSRCTTVPKHPWCHCDVLYLLEGE
jgi:phage portal protein BeeE